MFGVVLGVASHSGSAVLELWLFIIMSFCKALYGADLFACVVARCLKALLVVTLDLYW